MCHVLGRVTAIRYSRLATSLRSLALILPIHLHVYIYTHSGPRLQLYPYAAGHWHMRPDTSRPVYPRLQMWQCPLDEPFTLCLARSQINSRHTPMLPNLITPRNDDSTCSIRSMKHVVLVFKDSHGWIWPMIVTMQTWFMIFNFLIQDCQ